VEKVDGWGSDSDEIEKIKADHKSFQSGTSPIGNTRKDTALPPDIEGYRRRYEEMVGWVV